MTSRAKARMRDVVAAMAIAAAVGSAAAAQPTRQPTQAVQTAPTAFAGFSQNRDQPVKIVARRLEVRDKEKKATFIGDVHVTQGDTTMTCQTLVVFYVQNAGPSSASPAPATAGPVTRTVSTQPATSAPTTGAPSQISKLEAIGDVVVTQKDQTATGNKGTFDMKTNTITLEGNVVVTQGQNVVRGDRLVVDMTTGVSRVELAKGSNGRVEGLFAPASAAPGPAAPRDAAPQAPGASRDAAKPPPPGPMKLN